VSKEIRYTTDSKGRVRQWHCWAGQKDGVNGIFYTDGLVNMSEKDDFKLKEPTFKEAKEKNVGKTNYLSPKAQAIKMVEQEVGKKDRKNYFKTIQEAKDNKLWLPMLCPAGMVWSEYKTKPHVVFPVLASNKLDGARCNILIHKGAIHLQTRSGKQWLNFEHLRKDPAIVEFMKDYPNIILDGEVYNHEYKDSFEELMSVFRKTKPTDADRETSERVARYHIYDVYDKNNPDLNAFQRQQLLLGIIEEYFQECKYIVPEFSKVVKTEEEFDTFHEEALAEGYEGTILRIIDGPYDVDKRSKNLLKRKEKFDAEFRITDIVEGKGTNKGIASTIYIDLGENAGMNANHKASLVACVQDAGMAKGWNHEKCKDLLDNRDKYIGKMATIEYFEITAHGKLRFPKFKTVRDYE